MPSRPASRSRVCSRVLMTTYPVAGLEANVLRKRSRNALIGHTGAFGFGFNPLFQPQPEIRLSTDWSLVITEIGTSWLGCCPLTIVHGWWSPSAITTRFGSWKCCTNEVSALIVYWIDWP